MVAMVREIVSECELLQGSRLQFVKHGTTGKRKMGINELMAG
jgi:hypothetical protein